MELLEGIITPMLLNNSKSKGKAMQNQLIKAALRGFNGEELMSFSQVQW